MALNTGPADIFVGLALSTGPAWKYEYWPCGHLCRFGLKSTGPVSTSMSSIGPVWTSLSRIGPVWTSMSITFLRYDFPVFRSRVECSQYYYNLLYLEYFPANISTVYQNPVYNQTAAETASFLDPTMKMKSTRRPRVKSTIHYFTYELEHPIYHLTSWLLLIDWLADAVNCETR
jgi:hypothetical protein